MGQVTDRNRVWCHDDADVFIFMFAEEETEALTQTHAIRKGKMRGSGCAFCSQAASPSCPPRLLTSSPGAAEAGPLWHGSPFGWKMSPVLIFYF